MYKRQAQEVSSALGLGIDPDSTNTSTIEVDITSTTMPAWVRTLTSLRLAIAARIGLNEEADHDRLFAHEDTRGTVMVYDWLAAILDSVIQMNETD